MVSNSKILTVSYGTFSCTLEGFDDSFDTMKAIAEYFRDLSADDRYFGAEPVAPDIEMLARIAERKISRRVEAHDTNGKIHLRVGTAALTDTDTGVQHTTDPDPHTNPDAAPDTASRAAMPDADFSAALAARGAAETMETAPSQPRATHPASESIADKLRRIRAVATPGTSAFPSSGFDEDESTYDFVNGASASKELAQTEPEVEADLGDQNAEMAEAAIEDIGVDTPQPLEMVADVAGDGPVKVEIDLVTQTAPNGDAPAHPAVEGEASARLTDGGLDDITLEAAEAATADEAVEANNTPKNTSENTAQDDEILTRLGADTQELAHDETNATPSKIILSDDLANLYASAEQTGLEQTDDLDAFLRDAGVDASALDDYGSDDDSDAYTSDEDTLSQLLADALGETTSNDSTPIQSDAEQAPKASEIDTPAAEENAADAEAVPEHKAPSAERPLDARVVKMKRADLDAALASGDLQEDILDIAAPSDLSDEAEADLQRELAEVEAELQQARAPASVIPQFNDAPAPAQAAKPKTDTINLEVEATIALGNATELAATNRPEARANAETAAQDSAEETTTDTDARRTQHLDARASDAQAARIFDEADTQLEEPESNQRRSAIQHLRAAVAATKAERRAGGAMQVDVDDRPYRNDLQSAVRPRRPRPVAASMTPRPGAAGNARAAPLKLVAEQRIDAPAQPVRPRRITRADLVSAAPETPVQHDGANTSAAKPAPSSPGFADFAEQMGASSLTEMLEAAAAYMADIEGMQQFSRPMLMQKLREAQEEEFSREDGLRSFGQLLRQGKLQKLKGGRFAVTSVTEFRQSA
jgi:hypothetical protein